MMREMDEKRTAGRLRSHSLSVDARERAVVTGAEELLSFHDTEVCIVTSLGVLAIEGEELHIERLNLDEGQVIVRGLIYGANYDDSTQPQSTGGLFQRLLRR